jgi:hypothetical protein
VDADKWNMPIRLSTQLEVNVRFYVKLGFEIVREEDYTCHENKEYSYHTWFMIREPKENG